MQNLNIVGYSDDNADILLKAFFRQANRKDIIIFARTIYKKIGELNSYIAVSYTHLTDAKGNTTTYTYDSRDRLVKVTDALGNDITCTLNARGEAASITDRLGNVTKTGYHKILGVPVSVEDALGNISYYRYDKNGNVTKAIYPDGSEISYSYDKAGRIVTMTAQHLSLIHVSLTRPTPPAAP